MYVCVFFLLVTNLNFAIGISVAPTTQLIRRLSRSIASKRTFLQMKIRRRRSGLALAASSAAIHGFALAAASSSTNLQPREKRLRRVGGSSTSLSEKLESLGITSSPNTPKTENKLAGSYESDDLSVTSVTSTASNYEIPDIPEEISEFVRDLPPAPLAPCPVIQTPASKSLTLVLDLDETLVHSSLEPLEPHDLSCRVGDKTIYVRTRPHLNRFLEEVSRNFEVIVFTAGLARFAGPVLNLIDPNKQYISHRLYRDICYIKGGKFVKNLNVLGRDLERTVIVDNAAEAFGFQPANGILVESWFGDPDDDKLLRVLELLEEMLHLFNSNDAANVKQFIESRFEMEKRVLGGLGKAFYCQPRSF